MVHDMFENILVSAGFDDCLPRATGYEKEIRLEGKMRELDGWGYAALGDAFDPYALAGQLQDEEGVELEEREREQERRRKLPLTPALKAHLDVILSSLKKASLS